MNRWFYDSMIGSMIVPTLFQAQMQNTLPPATMKKINFILAINTIMRKMLISTEES